MRTMLTAFLGLGLVALLTSPGRRTRAEASAAWAVAWPSCWAMRASRKS